MKNVPKSFIYIMVLMAFGLGIVSTALVFMLQHNQNRYASYDTKPSSRAEEGLASLGAESKKVVSNVTDAQKLDTNKPTISFTYSKNRESFTINCEHLAVYTCDLYSYGADNRHILIRKNTEGTAEAVEATNTIVVGWSFNIKDWKFGSIVVAKAKGTKGDLYESDPLTLSSIQSALTGTIQ